MCGKIVADDDKSRRYFYVSKEKNKLSFSRIVELLRQSYWAKDRPEDLIKQSVEHSVCYGVYDQNDYMVGFARIITDFTRVFYLMDVIIDEAYRHRGLGTLLMDQIMADVGDLYGILHTDDAQGFYKKYGFSDEEKVRRYTMEKDRRG
ncbi:MAG: GNAT family N-acetyltransferase [Lachnospiraceae bacterium]